MNSGIHEDVADGAKQSPEKPTQAPAEQRDKPGDEQSPNHGVHAAVHGEAVLLEIEQIDRDRLKVDQDIDRDECPQAEFFLGQPFDRQGSG